MMTTLGATAHGETKGLKGWKHNLALGVTLALAALTIAVFIAAMPAQRQQTRLVVFTALLVFGLMALVTLAESAGLSLSPGVGLVRDAVMSDLALVALMTAFAVALLRHRRRRW